jgi:multimeric flavodoxin WrbA
MKISTINGSQKTGESNTGIILKAFKTLINDVHEVKNYKLDTKLFTEEIYNDIISGDKLVLAFPPFAVSVPSNMLKMLIEL